MPKPIKRKAEAAGMGAGVELPTKMAKTARGRRILKAREAKVNEDDKKLLIMRGNNSGEKVDALLHDLHTMKKPNALLLGRKQEFRPFDSPDDVEYLCEKNNCSLFAFGSRNKKVPFRLVLGRTFDAKVLDMHEFAVENYRPASSFSGTSKPAISSRVIVVAQGAQFERSDEMKSARSLLIDTFSAGNTESVCSQGLQRAVILTAATPPAAGGAPSSSAPSSAAATATIHVAHYFVSRRRRDTDSEEPASGVHLEPLGPEFDLHIRASNVADLDRWKQSMVLPRQEKPKTVKNVTTVPQGDTIARVHVGRQDLEKVPHHHAKAFRSAAGKARKGSKP
eukprot:GHVU01193441.1.p1 GENE.GHVU01193441.1~~GHVU01193441.1.p1  ORF type:complete len:337 (+),score=61.45 GHVU01193441.1:98-1108(+)